MRFLTDPHTGEQFAPKRKNQKFASAYNRVSYHNTRSNKIRSAKAFIDEPLSRNHKILMSQITEVDKPKVFSKEFLKGCGFNLSVLTHFESYQNKTLPALYNFLFLDLFENNTGSLTIIRRK